MFKETRIGSVAVIGAGASGAATAAALAAEDVFHTIRVFERRETPGGTWIYDADPGPSIQLQPGKIPLEVDPPLAIPHNLPATTTPTQQARFDTTPIYAELTTNVPDIIMSFSDKRFAYGPFVPHWVPRQYIQDYFSVHKIDKFLALNTTVEDVTRLSPSGWRLTLRRYDPFRKVDVWWDERFDAVVLANGHYSVPFIPAVKGLGEYLSKFPGRISHSKAYRTPGQYLDQKVLIIGNSASGFDVTTQLVRSQKLRGPVYQSRRSRSRWDGKDPPEGIVWKPVIREFDASTGDVIFEDGSVLSDLDAVIYCTGYLPSFPFWNARANGVALFNYGEKRLEGFYQHTFSMSFPDSLAIVGLPRVLTFRSFEYQAVAIARLFSGRNSESLPSAGVMRAWEEERARLTKSEHRPFHGILWDNGETMDWFRYLYRLSGLPLLEGKGRVPPVLDEDARWAYDHIKKYPEPPRDDEKFEEEGWSFVEEHMKDSAHFV